MEGTGEGCGFFYSLKLPYFSTMSQKFCRLLKFQQLQQIQPPHRQHYMAPQRAAMAVIAPTQIPTISPTLSSVGIFPFPLPKRLKNMCLEVLKIVNQGSRPRQIQPGYRK